MADRPSRVLVTAGRREAAMWAVCLMVAASLRWHDLDAAPLSTTEATNVWAAWSSATGSGDVDSALATPPTSALLFSLNWLLLFVTGGAGGDGIARAWSALAGVLLVLAPLLLRDVLGPAGAVGAGVLLTLDPVLIRISRMADGASLTALGALLTLAAFTARNTPTDGTQARSLSIAAPCVALLLVSGEHAWAVAALLAVGLWATGRSLPHAAGANRAPPSRIDHAALVGRAALAALLLTTTGFMQWDGPAYVSASVGAAGISWLAREPAMTIGARLARAGAGQSVLLILGAVGLGEWMWRRRADRVAAGAAVAVVSAAMTLACKPGATDGDRVPLTLLFAVAGAPVLARTLARVADIVRGRTRGAAVLIAACAVLTLSVPVRSALRATDETPANATQPAVRQLARDLSALCSGRVDECCVQAVADPWPDVVLAWYLRGLSCVRWVLAPDADSGAVGRPAAVVVPLAGRAAPPPPPGYVGRVYPLRREDPGGRGVGVWVDDQADRDRMAARHDG